MKHPKTGLPAVYLKPGELYFAKHPTVVSTVLGSCVSVTMYSRAAGTGAICHALLPEGPQDDAFRYVNTSILHMLDMFAAQGIKHEQIEVKVFGGSEMIEDKGRSTLSIGRRNVEIAEQVLAARGLSPLASDVGGKRGRKLFFYTHTGEVFLKRLHRRKIERG